MSRKPAKTLHGSTSKPKRNSAPTEARPASSTLVDLQEQVRALTRELAEAREQQTATADVLRVISSSPGELEPVFQAMLGNATKLCEAEFGLMHRYDGDAFYITAMQGMPSDYASVVRREAVRPGPETVLARMTRTKQVAQIEDVRAERGYAERDPMSKTMNWLARSSFIASKSAHLRISR